MKNMLMNRFRNDEEFVDFSLNNSIRDKDFFDIVVKVAMKNQNTDKWNADRLVLNLKILSSGYNSTLNILIFAENLPKSMKNYFAAMSSAKYFEKWGEKSPTKTL